MSEPTAENAAPTVLVIPAHNEAAVLRRCISEVLRDAGPAEFDVLVVSNGSTDATAELARQLGATLGQRIDVIELTSASKVAALRAADEFLSTSRAARIYLDADVVLSTDAARSLVAALQVEQPRLAHARIDVDTSASSWLVRHYYNAWLATGYIRRQDAGSGVFAVNAAGVSRISPWPDVINDDGYVARRFGAGERVVCDVPFRSFATRSVGALIRRRARIVNGNRQLDQLFPHDGHVEAAAGGSGLKGLLTAVTGRRLPPVSAAVFVAVTVAARALAWWRRLTGTTARWSTDTTTRPGDVITLDVTTRSDSTTRSTTRSDVTTRSGTP